MQGIIISSDVRLQVNFVLEITLDGGRGEGGSYRPTRVSSEVLFGCLSYFLWLFHA